MLKLAIAALLLVGCTPMQARKVLHVTANITEGMAHASFACDAGSTHTAIRMGYNETNPVMGSHPDGSVVGAYFVGTAAGLAVINRVVPDAIRIGLNLTVVGIEAEAVGYNHSIGVPMCGI